MVTWLIKDGELLTISMVRFLNNFFMVRLAKLIMKGTLFNLAGNICWIDVRFLSAFEPMALRSAAKSHDL